MIDAKKIRLAMNAAARVVENSHRFHGELYVRCAGDGMDGEIPYLDAAKILRETAAKEIALVKHGHWIPDYGDDSWECSCCKCLWTTIGGTPKDNNMAYCPECGAKMDGGEE